MKIINKIRETRFIRFLCSIQLNIKKILFKGTITKRIRTERKKVGIARKFSFTLYLPSIFSAIIPVISVVILYIISYLLPRFISDKTPITVLKYLFLNNEFDHYQNIISIHAGIGIIIFALIIFMAESMRGSNRKDRAIVFLKESYIFPITIVEIFVFFTFIFGPINIISYLMVIFLGLAVIISLMRTFRILIYPHLLHKKTIKILKGRLIQPIDSEIDYRIGNWVLSDFINKSELKLKYNPYFDKSRFNYKYFKYEKEGIVYDINLDNLKKIANLIEEEANRNNYYWKPQIKKKGTVSIGQASINTAKDTTKEADKSIGNIDKERFLMIGFRSFLNQDNNLVLAVNKNLIKNPEVLIKIEKLIATAFIIKDKDHFERGIRFELANLKDQFIDAIQKKHIGEIREFKEVYISIFENFLEYFKKINIVHSFKRARQERSNIFGGWKEIESLIEDVFDIFEKAMETEDRRIILEINHFPISIAKKAIPFHDHYLFQEFIKFPEYLYEHAKKVSDPELAGIMIDSTWRLLKELVEFDLLDRITRKDLPKQELESYRDFIIDIILIYQNLIRSTILKNDPKSFNNILSSFKDLFSDYYDFKFSKKFNDFDRQNLEFVEKDEIFEYKENLKNIYSHIDIKIKQLYLGLSSWLLNEIVVNESENYLKFYEELVKGISADLKQLFEVFIETIDSDVDHFWGWTHWILPADGKVHSVDFYNYKYRLFCVKSLQILNLNPISIEDIDLPSNRQFSYLAEEKSRLMVILDDIQTNQDKWKLILSSQEIEKVDMLKAILNNIKQKQDKLDVDNAIKKNISGSKIEEFGKDVINSFYKNSSIRKILDHYKLYIGNTKVKKPDMNRFGINTIDNKEAFFDKWHIGYPNWGEEYGRNLAFGEDINLFRKILNKCKKINIEEFDIKINEIRDSHKKIILTDASSIRSFFYNKKEYMPSYYKDCPKKDIDSFKGVYRTKNTNIRIYEIFLRKINNNILLLDYSKLGKLIQFSPLDLNDDANDLTDIFYFNVKSFSESSDIIEEFTNKPPSWLEKIGNKKEQIKYLKKKVLIHIFERYEFNINTDFEGFLFKTN